MKYITPIQRCARYARAVITLPLLSLAAVLAAGSAASAAPIDFTAQLVAPGINPQVAGNRIVWQNGVNASNTEVYLWQSGVTTQLTSNAVHDTNPKVSSSGVLWERGTGTAAEMMFWNGTSETQLTTNTVREQLASLSDTRAAWMTGAGNGLDIVTWDLTNPPTNITSGLPPANTPDTAPQLRGNNTVWVRGSTPAQTVMKYDGVNPPTQVGSSTLAINNPAVGGDIVAWEGFFTSTIGVNGREIYINDGSGMTRLTDNEHPDFAPQVDSGRVTWWGGTFNNNQVFLWDGSSTQQLSNSGLNQFPKIDGQFVVWQGWEGFGGGDLEIFLWDGSEVHQLTDNAVNDTMPQISGNHIVWQQGANVWHTTITVVPEPGSIVLAGLGLLFVSATAVRRKRAKGKNG